jgi:hypothetical protein
MAGLKEDVLRLDVAVDDVVRVGIGQRVGDFPGQPDRLLDRERLIPRHPLPQRLALDQRHDVEQEPFGVARVMQGENVGMVELGGGADLTQEAITAQGGGQFRPQHLDRHLAIVSQVVGEIDRGHATLPQFTFNFVAIGEGTLELSILGHRTTSLCTDTGFAGLAGVDTSRYSPGSGVNSKSQVSPTCTDWLAGPMTAWCGGRSAPSLATRRQRTSELSR